jgi:hypothetical protein
MILDKKLEICATEGTLHVRVYTVTGLLLAEARIQAGESKELTWDVPGAILVID